MSAFRELPPEGGSHRRELFQGSFRFLGYSNPRRVDPNVFLGTIVFPNAVAHGWASGIDVRLDVAPQHGWSGFVCRC